MSKPLPASVLSPKKKSSEAASGTGGIVLGDSLNWNPAQQKNGHVLILGTSGAGKTQTLKAIAHSLPELFPTLRRVVIDFHGDQALPDEVCYPLNMESPWGINPLALDLDRKGGGPGLQAIAVAAVLRKALAMGANQEGLTIEILRSCYQHKGITSSPDSWNRKPPTFADVKDEIDARLEDGCKESGKLALKLAATFQYGIFNKPQPPLDAPLIRFDLSALGKVPGLGAIAAESLVKQLMDAHRLMGETKSPRTYIFIDEAKEVKNSRSVDTVLADGRKYGLSCCLASQRDAHISDNAIANSDTKIILPVDQSEVVRVAKRFRFSDKIVEKLEPLEALVRMGTIAQKCRIKPYYER